MKDLRELQIGPAAAAVGKKTVGLPGTRKLKSDASGCNKGPEGVRSGSGLLTLAAEPLAGTVLSFG